MASCPMRRHFRPFGPVGSLVEILVGGELLRSVLWTNEPYGTTAVAVISAVGALILAVGIVGLVLNARAWIHAVSSRP